MTKIKVKSVLVVNVERGSHVTPDRSADRQVNVASDNPLKQQWPRKKNHQDKKKKRKLMCMRPPAVCAATMGGSGGTEPSGDGPECRRRYRNCLRRYRAW